MQSLEHTCIIKPVGFNVNPPSIVLPYFEAGDLFNLVSKYHDIISFNIASRIFGDIARAVAYLHRSNIVHRDIKLESM